MPLIARIFFALFVTASLTGAAPAQPRSALIDEFVVSEAQSFENTLNATWSTKGKDAKGWLADGDKAIVAEDYRAATGYFASSALLDKNNGGTWLKLARAYLAIDTEKSNEKFAFARNAGSSAYLAYARSKTPGEQGAALAVIAESLGMRNQWRPALRLYKASLALAPDPDVQEAYDQAFNEHGFRMLDYTSDNESNSPRICVQFSDNLAKGRVDFANYVTVNGEKPAAVRVNGAQLCVTDLIHGKRYEVKVRSGIPSTEDDLLPKEVDLTVYIRDRSPSVRMSGRNYVLPRIGQQGIPVISINTKLVKASIYRIGDRRLAAEVLDGSFEQQLQTYELKQISDQKGEKLWSGTMPVASKLNEEVTTAFPVDTLLPNLKPGLYIIAASAADENAKSSEANESSDNSDSEDYSTKATQWFVVSDLGLTAFSGADGVHVYVRSLATAEPVANAEIRLVARNNEVLGTVKTNDEGAALFAAGLSHGTGGLAPAIVVARGADNDYGFLDITKQAFDLSDRGVGGRTPPGPLDAMVFTERGVYRPGENVYVTALLRDAAANAVPGTPLILKLYRPDGVEDKRQALADQGNGGRSWQITLPDTAMTGSWRLAAYTDPKGASLYEKTFLVEDYVPERLEMKLAATQPTISANTPGTISLTSRYLYGAPASNLGLEGEVVISATNEVSGFPGFRVGQESEKFTTVRKELEALPNTDATGAASLPVPLPDLPQTSKALNADVTIRLREPSGRALSDKVAMKVDTGKSFIGVKPLFDGSVDEGAPAEFEVVGIGPDGKQTALTGLKWELLRIESQFQWYSRDNRWTYESVTYESRADGGTLDAPASGTVRIKAPVESGTYRLDIASAEAKGPATSLKFAAGWYTSEASDTPEILNVGLDRASYRPGDEIKVQVMPRMSGEALVAIVSDRVLATKMIKVTASGGTASFKVDPAWGPGAYATAIAYRPMDSAAKRMPSRAVGTKWIPLDTKPRTLSVALDTPPSVRPAGPVTVSAAVSGLDAGENATLVISGVDLGILNITRYKTPKPGAYFFAQRRLGLEMRDLYGKLIDGMQGVRGAVRSGGDEGGLEMAGRPLAEVPLAVYSGPLQTDANGNARVTFTLPAFNGTMRLAAQVWTPSKLGHGEKDVIVRDTVVAQATTPKFLMLGDSSNMHLSIENVEAPAGTYKLTAKAGGGIEVTGPAERELTLDLNKRVSQTIGIRAAFVGDAHVTFALNGPGGVAIERTYAIPVEPPAPNLRRQTNLLLAASTGSLRVGAELIRDLVPASAKVSVTASRTASFDVPGLLLGLDRYPFGCAEQTTSRALPLLYYDEVASRARLSKEPKAKPAIEKAIVRLYDMQSSTGGFGLWGPSYEDIWLTAYVSDFLTRAKEKGFAVRDTNYDIALDRLKNAVNNARDFKTGGETLAYSLYVLARSGRSVLGDLRYYADTKIDAFSTPIAKAQLAAGLAMLGDKERAALTFNAALRSLASPDEQVPLANRTDYGTALRDAAAVLALMGEGGATTPQLQKAFNIVMALRAHYKETTTQESLWLVLAARTLDAQNKDLALEVNGVPVKGSFQTVLSGSDLSAPSIPLINVSAMMPNSASQKFQSAMTQEQFAKDGLVVKNDGHEAVPASILVTGDGIELEPSAESGFKIERKAYAPDGREIAFDKLKQNDRVVVVLKVTEVEPKLGQIVVEDRLPAGFDIENPALLKGSDLKSFSWLNTANSPVFTAFRDDRFVAAYTLYGGRKEPAQLTMAYVMRAVTPGTYTHAGARVEDMYRPGRFARTSGSKVEIAAAQ
ncbi:MAG: alpha-2-macroglobulin family protein [Rhodomicrobium sp.]